MSNRIKIPVWFNPLPHQREAWYVLTTKQKRYAYFIWHRRAGKECVMWNWCVYEALTSPTPGLYFYFLPIARQARDVIWNARTHEGVSFLSAIPGIDRPGKPGSLVKSVDKQLMQIELVNGSIIKMKAADQDTQVGTNARGIFMSEFAMPTFPPEFFDYMRPILLQNPECVVGINTTPRGLNHAWRLWERVKDHPDWYTSKLTVDDTFNADGTPYFGPEKLQQEIDTGMSPHRLRQEYYCDFYAASSGSYYGDQIEQLTKANRISETVIHDPLFDVHTAWDLGFSDYTAIWFFQLGPNGQIHVIDYYANTGKGLDHYLAKLAELAITNNYSYGHHIFPHDVRQTDYSTGKTRLQYLQARNIKPLVCPKTSKEDGRQAVRAILPKCWFSKNQCKEGLEALRQYHAKDEGEVDFKGKDVYGKEVHDWASHGADAFRYLALMVPMLEKYGKDGMMGRGPTQEFPQVRRRFGI